MQRSYYSASFKDFKAESPDAVLGKLTKAHPHDVEQTQLWAWDYQIEHLQSSDAIGGEDGIAFEFTIPRMGKRVDNIIFTRSAIIVLEYKVGQTDYPKYAADQVLDYCLDLKNFHEGSHNRAIVPVLVCTMAPAARMDLRAFEDGVYDVVRANADGLDDVIRRVAGICAPQVTSFDVWENSPYKPTPTIIEAAQALYRGHQVEEISRSDSGARNLTSTTAAIERIIHHARAHDEKAICFMTGVPGAGKTLAGLNLANSLHSANSDDHAVFLSGNGPLVTVLQEALARYEAAGEQGMTKKKALSKTKAFIQNIHHFRDDGLRSDDSPPERVAVFDEAQRAWSVDQTRKFMLQKKGVPEFSKSEPEFLIEIMDRHDGWAVIVCLIGGGQEINTGEAGLPEWFRALRNGFPDWRVYVSDRLDDYEYTQGHDLFEGIGQRLETVSDLHLATSIRSFRSEKVSDFVKHLLDNEPEKARSVYQGLKDNYPIMLTRSLETAKRAVRELARGTERFGLIASSGGYRLRPEGVVVKSKAQATNWFLNGATDVRSSYFLEDVATEFDIQGLEIDWALVAWDADFRYMDGDWCYYAFKGSKWQNVNDPERRLYLKNAYRVLLTRARQGMVIFVPEGSEDDWTRPPEYYDGVFNYLRSIGIQKV